MAPTAESLLIAWFGDAPLETGDALDARSRLWFGAPPEFDRALREQFGKLPDRALDGQLLAWRREPRTCLALVLALDQLPRNLYRGSSQAFAYDAAAREVALDAIDRGLDQALRPVEATFLYLPFEHAEDRTLQARSVHLYRALAKRAPPALTERFESFLSYAERHRAVIDRFGRFPHRNRALRRASTPEEERYLAEGGETFAAPEP